MLYKRIIFLTLMVIVVGFVACESSEDPPTPSTTPIDPDPDPVSLEPSLPTEEGLLATDLTPGFRTGQMSLSQDKSWIYSISVPDNIQDTVAPLIIALHGGNGDSRSAETFMQCLPLPAFKNLDAIIFAPTGGQWWDDLHSDRVVEFVRLAKLHWPIDSTKVAVTGYSNGGTGSVHFAKHFPESFSAAIPMAADYMDEVCPEIPTYMIHGSDDEFYSSSALKGIVDGLSAKGCDLQLHLVDGASHGSACQMVADLVGAGTWLQREVWVE